LHRHHHQLHRRADPLAPPPPPGPGCGSGVLLEEELARAVRHESAAAICHWWRVSEGMPSLPVSLQLVKALGVPVERFAEGVEDPAEEE
jgi:hypothetical protein